MDLSLQVLDKNFSMFDVVCQTNLFELSFDISVTNALLLIIWQMDKYHFCYTLKVIWYIRKDIKLDIAINYVRY